MKWILMFLIAVVLLPIPVIGLPACLLVGYMLFAKDDRLSR